eukprot:scaffold44153_cov137-Amphora_coffeaeformis.AAC.1
MHAEWKTCGHSGQWDHETTSSFSKAARQILQELEKGRSVVDLRVSLFSSFVNINGSPAGGTQTVP